jgi:hypothetical protein
LPKMCKCGEELGRQRTEPRCSRVTEVPGSGSVPFPPPSWPPPPPSEGTAPLCVCAYDQPFCRLLTRT